MIIRLTRSPQPSLQAAVARIPLDRGPNGIAAFLEAEGVTGEPGAASRCPLAVYLNRVNGPGVEICVTVTQATQWAAGHRYELGRRACRQKVALPEALSAFVARFDTDCYPTLWTPRYRAVRGRLMACADD